MHTENFPIWLQNVRFRRGIVRSGEYLGEATSVSRTELPVYDGASAARRRPGHPETAAARTARHALPPPREAWTWRIAKPGTTGARGTLIDVDFTSHGARYLTENVQPISAPLLPFLSPLRLTPTPPTERRRFIVVYTR